MIPYLSLMLLITLLGSILTYLLGKDDKNAKLIAIIFSFIPLVLSLIMWATLDFNASAYQFVEDIPWIGQLGISYTLGVDGLSFPMVLLATILTPLALIFSWDTKHRVREFYALMLMLEVAMLGVFVSLDMFLFFIFWEVGLVPMYFLISIWGGPRKKYAAIKFFLFTQAASILVLMGIVAIALNVGSFSLIDALANAGSLTRAIQIPIFLGFLIGFGAKMPIVPLHTWLPDAHVEAPTAASVILAGVLLKMGGYGLIRFGIQLMPEATTYFMPLMAVIGVVSMIYGAMLCLAQTDFKRMVAYSSVSHMGLVLLGIATMTINGLSGAIFQMFAHGLVSGGLFMMAGILLHKTGTRDIRVLRGLAPKVPILAVALITLSLASLGLPGLISFITEVLIFVGTYEAFGYWVFIPLIALVLTAAYYLWMLQKVAFGPYNKKLGDIHDLYNYELIPVAVLIFLIVLFGIYPGPVINMVTAFAGGIV